MSQTVGAYVLDRLHDNGVERIYGYPGDGINGIIGGFHEHGDEIEFVQCRHEEIASFAACAHAKFTGEVGVCMATSGPGAVHLLNGLYDAKLDHQPVVAIIGQQKTFSLGGNYQQEIDLVSLYKDVASEYLQVCMVASQARTLIDRAIQIARTTRSPTAVIIPADVQEEEWDEPPREHGVIYSTPHEQQIPSRLLPAESELRRAAEVLNAGERVAILVGQGAATAADEVIEVAELLGAGVAKALNGRAAVPDDIPYVTGPIGLLGTKPSYELMDGCDTLLMIGTSFPYAEWLPEPGAARGVQIDIDGRLIGIRYPMEVSLIGDSRDTLRELIPQLERKQDRSWQEQIEGEVETWWELLEKRAMQEVDRGVNPTRIFHELSPRLPDQAILTADSGSATNWWARHLKMRKGMKSALSGTLATMCPGVPYAFAAKMAYPDRPVVGCLGDGAMQMLGINALIDIAARWEDWENKQTVIVVLNNEDLNQVTWEQRVMSGDPKLESSQVLPSFNYATYAEQLGLVGIRVEQTDQIVPAIEQALSAGRPALIDAVTDPEFPPLPPHIKVDQAISIAKSLGRGDPHPARIVKQALKGKVKEFITR